MKKRWPLKINVSLMTLLVWWCLMMLKAQRWVFFCYGVMFMHEFAHVLSAWYLKCPVEKVMIYPFGLYAEMKDTESLSFLFRLFLYGSGPCVHLIVFIMIEVLKSFHLISVVMHDYCIQLNLNYLLFNLLPVYPLDGYQIMLSFLYCFLPYRSALILSEMFSFVVLFLFMFYSPQTIVIFISFLILLSMNVIRCFRLTREMHQFYLKRYLNGVNYQSKIHRFEDCFVYRNNLIIKENEILNEKMLLKKILKL